MAGTPLAPADILFGAMRTDDELWQRAVAGDADAFGVLFERHGRALYNFLFRLCGDWSEAEDLTSATFLVAYRRRGCSNVEEGKVLPWLYGVALNAARNRRRSLRRGRLALGRAGAPRAEHDIGPDALARIDAERRMRELLPLIRSLPRRERDVLSLCGLGGLSYEDAAAALGVPVGTVRSRLSRARARLRELAAASGHEGDETVADRRFAES